MPALPPVTIATLPCRPRSMVLTSGAALVWCAVLHPSVKAEPPRIIDGWRVDRTGGQHGHPERPSPPGDGDRRRRCYNWSLLLTDYAPGATMPSRWTASL